MDVEKHGRENKGKKIFLNPAFVAVILFFSFFISIKGNALASGNHGKKLVYVLFDLSESAARKRNLFLHWFDQILKNLHEGDRIVVEAIRSGSALNATYPVNDAFPEYSFWKDNPLMFKRKMANLRENIRKRVAEFLKSGKSKTTEIMSSLLPAQQLFDSYPEYHRKILVIMSDMMEESYFYNFEKHVPEGRETQWIIDRERRGHRLPSLRGVKIYVCGAGGRNSDAMFLIKRFWLTYFKACGADLKPANYGPALPRFEE